MQHVFLCTRYIATDTLHTKQTELYMVGKVLRLQSVRIVAEGFKTEDFAVCMKTDDLRSSSIIIPVTEITLGRQISTRRKTGALSSCMIAHVWKLL